MVRWGAVLEYLKRLEWGGWRPNFWCSEEYARRAGLTERYTQAGDICGVFDGEQLVLPPLTGGGEFQWPEEFPADLWSDVAGFAPTGGVASFLDWEYIYEPRAFLKMEGGRWMTFRKNARKFPARAGRELSYVELAPEQAPEALTALLVEWLEAKGADAEIHDGDLLLDYVLNGDHRKALFDAAGGLWGVNVWDENYCYVNFRFCVCRGEPFLSEYMRWLFYTDAAILSKHKPVNDGGTLGSERLKFFKDKLNPTRVREVKGWVRSGATKTS